MRSQIVCIQHLRKFTVMIFHSVTFVNDHVFPLQFRQHALVFYDIFIGRQQNVELRRSHL